MVHAKNYETVSTSVKVKQRKLLASFFSAHGVHDMTTNARQPKSDCRRNKSVDNILLVRIVKFSVSSLTWPFYIFYSVHQFLPHNLNTIKQ